MRSRASSICLSMRRSCSREARMATLTEADIPADLLDEVETYRLQLVEKIAENDEELMLRYLEDDEISPDELRVGAQVGSRQRAMSIPVLASGATNNRAIKPPAGRDRRYLPAPAASPPHSGRRH